MLSTEQKKLCSCENSVVLLLDGLVWDRRAFLFTSIFPELELCILNLHILLTYRFSLIHSRAAYFVLI